MFDIRRVPGGAPGRSRGSACNGFAWAVAVGADHSLDMYRHTASALREIDRVLAELGTNKTALVNATVYIANMQLKDEMDRAWNEWIGPDPAHWPQRDCVEAGLYREDQVEIVVIAACER
jgi:enamine deaminase RidA (YjgF/YER057c/UK114 family)